jgi:SAM-dependent methyltransferase
MDQAMSSSYRASLDRWLKGLDVIADNVLDVGGAQLPLKGRTRSWDVLQYRIADLPQPHVGSPIPDIEVDLNLVDNTLPHNEFDQVFCLEVFEYIWNPFTAMMHISDSLKHDGSAWITFPSFYPLHNPVEDDALRYMPGGIEKLAEHSGLKIRQMIPRRPDTNALQLAWSAERMRAAKGEDHNFIGWIVEFTK